MRDTSAAQARIARQTKWSFIFFLVGGGLITASALIDVLFGLGGGYDWQDVLGGAGILALGFVVYGGMSRDIQVHQHPVRQAMTSALHP